MEETRICTICGKELPLTNEYFAMYIKDKSKAEALFNRLGEYISFDKPDFDVSNGDVLQWTDAGWESIKDRIEELQTVFYKIAEKGQKK